MSTFWHTLPRPFFILAPMEAVTDVVFRHVITRAGQPDVFFTEFTNAMGWYRAGDKAIGGRLIKTDDESPIVAQLWGSDPEAMAAMSGYCRQLGYDGIDINMGCPDQSAVKAGGGAGMIRTPEKAWAIIKAAKSGGLPVSVKTRLGYSNVDEWREWLGGLLRQDIAVLTVHLRTKKEMSKVPAHFELIPEIKKLRDELAPDTLLVINGDVRDRVHGIEFYDTYGIDGIMIGRGIFTNPYAFSDRTDKPSKQEFDRQEPAAKQRAGDDASGDQHDKLIELLRFHLDEYDRYYQQTSRPFETLKRFFKIYIRDFDGASDLRVELMNCTTTEEVRSILDRQVC